MAAADDSITEPELREAFQRSGLWRRGWNYQRAITTENVRRGLLGIALSIRKKLEQTGKPAPVQRALI